MIRVKILDGQHKGCLVDVHNFKQFDYGGDILYVHTAAIIVYINQYCYKAYTDVASIHKDKKEVNLTAAIEEGIWTVEGTHPNAPFLYKTQALSYKSKAEWIEYASPMSGYGVSPENLRGRRLTWKERLLGKILCP